MSDILQRAKDKKLIAIVNKIDKTDQATYNPLAPTPPNQADIVLEVPIIPISAKKGTNIEQLENAIYQAADIPSITQNDVIVTHLRHYEALAKAHDDIIRVETGLQNGLSGDLLSEDLRACIDHLSEIVGGTITPDETLGNIFSHFCVGK